MGSTAQSSPRTRRTTTTCDIIVYVPAPVIFKKDSKIVTLFHETVNLTEQCKNGVDSAKLGST